VQQLRVDTRPIIFNREAGESVIPYHLIIIEQVECVVFGVRSSNKRHRTDVVRSGDPRLDCLEGMGSFI